MRNVKNIIKTMVVGSVLVVWSGLAHAQNFADLQTNEVKNEANTTDTTDATAKFVQPSAATEASQAPRGQDAFKDVMNPDEYKQFMAARAYADKASTYTLGPNDVISITVLRHPEVSGQYEMNTEGKIQYEFAGDVLLSGLTKEQAADTIAKILTTYIINPQVAIKIVGYNSKIVYVVGEVGAPGKIFMRGDTITVREALLLAGLPLLSANTSHAVMFTPSNSGKIERRTVDVNALLYKGDLRQDFVMKPGDTLYLPATFWAKAMRVISPITQPVGQAASTGVQLQTGFTP